MIYSFIFYLKIAFQNLIIHKGRIGLALLGILFAVMSLVAFGNISDGLKKQIDNEIGKFGKNLIIIRSGIVHIGSEKDQGVCFRNSRGSSFF